jgi:hypothetical protein
MFEGFEHVQVQTSDPECTINLRWRLGSCPAAARQTRSRWRCGTDAPRLARDFTVGSTRSSWPSIQQEASMLIVDSQIHIWQNGKMSAQHRQIPTYSVDDALAEMASAGVDAAVIHPPSSLGEAVNVLAVEAARLPEVRPGISISARIARTSLARASGMLGFGSPSTSPTRRPGGRMARSTGSGRLARKPDCPSGSWPVGTWRRWRGSPSGTPV